MLHNEECFSLQQRDAGHLTLPFVIGHQGCTCKYRFILHYVTNGFSIFFQRNQVKLERLPEFCSHDYADYVHDISLAHQTLVNFWVKFKSQHSSSSC